MESRDPPLLSLPLFDGLLHQAGQDSAFVFAFEEM
jgi:hypothetical protein